MVFTRAHMARWICFLFIISPQYIYSANEKSSCFEWRFQQVVRIKISQLPLLSRSVSSGFGWISSGSVWYRRSYSDNWCWWELADSCCMKQDSTVIIVDQVTCRGVCRVFVSPGLWRLLLSFTLMGCKIAGVSWISRGEEEERMERWLEECETGDWGGYKSCIHYSCEDLFWGLPRISSGATSFRFSSLSLFEQIPGELQYEKLFSLSIRFRLHDFFYVVWIIFISHCFRVECLNIQAGD